MIDPEELGRIMDAIHEAHEKERLIYSTSDEELVWMGWEDEG